MNNIFLNLVVHLSRLTIVLPCRTVPCWLRHIRYEFVGIQFQRKLLMFQEEESKLKAEFSCEIV
jgi:hypothetical protein